MKTLILTMLLATFTYSLGPVGTVKAKWGYSHTSWDDELFVNLPIHNSHDCREAKRIIYDYMKAYSTSSSFNRKFNVVYVSVPYRMKANMLMSELRLIDWSVAGPTLFVNTLKKYKNGSHFTNIGCD